MIHEHIVYMRSKLIICSDSIEDCNNAFLEIQKTKAAIGDERWYPNFLDVRLMEVEHAINNLNHIKQDLETHLSLAKQNQETNMNESMETHEKS